MTVDFSTYCCSKDKHKLLPVLHDHINSHGYDFNDKHLIFQRCEPEQIEGVSSWQIDKKDYNKLLTQNGISPINQEADDYTHGWSASHYWKHHCVNHLKALNVSTADYIVLADADCYIKSQRGSWVKEGINIMQKDKSIMVVSPSDGTRDARRTQTMSQQVMLVERQRLLGIDFDMPFTGFKEGGPFQEYYFMLEGRIARYMEKHGLYRFMLDSKYRYWHSQW